MSLNGYEELEHIADLALKVWGEDFETLLRQAAFGFYHLMGAEIGSGPDTEEVFTIPQGSRESILVDFLNELLFMVEDAQMIFHDFVFERSERVLTVRAFGCKSVALERTIKAVTFHELEIEQVGNRLEARITFDV